MCSSATTDAPASSAAPTRARVWTCACAALGACLLSPALGTGLVAADELQAVMLRDAPGLPGLARQPLDLFRFTDGRPETVRAWIEQGVLPWWVDPRAKIAFFRPLASWTHALDYA